MGCISYSKGEMEQLEQLWTVTWDGNLISKAYRDKLVKTGLAQRAHGFNWLTPDGVSMVEDIKELG